jgi:hypothetical protein
LSDSIVKRGKEKCGLTSPVSIQLLEVFNEHTGMYYGGKQIIRKKILNKIIYTKSRDQKMV